MSDRFEDRPRRKGRAQAPPERRCTRCGGKFRSWQFYLCTGCRRAVADDGLALVEMVREARLERRAGYDDAA